MSPSARLPIHKKKNACCSISQHKNRMKYTEFPTVVTIQIPKIMLSIQEYRKSALGSPRHTIDWAPGANETAGS